MQGSCSKVNSGTTAQLQYQDIDESRYFDIVNLSNYDLILGTPFLFQHKVLMGLNEAQVIIESPESVPIAGSNITKLAAQVVELVEDDLA